MKRFKLIQREIGNYFYLRKILKREASSEQWIRFNLRSNWFGRIYTVLSLRDQDMGEEEMVRNWKAMEMMRPINDYLTSLDLQEIIFPSIEPIPDSRSYLVVYTPLFKETTITWLVSRFILLAGALSGIIYLLKRFL